MNLLPCAPLRSINVCDLPAKFDSLAEYCKGALSHL